MLFFFIQGNATLKSRNPRFIIASENHRIFILYLFSQYCLWKDGEFLSNLKLIVVGKLTVNFIFLINYIFRRMVIIFFRLEVLVYLRYGSTLNGRKNLIFLIRRRVFKC